MKPPHLPAAVSPLAAIMMVLPGCDKVTDAALEIYGKGTVAGVEHCIKNKASELLPKAAVMRLCVEEHQEIVKAEIVGDAWYYPSLDKGATFSGSLHNKSRNIVVTQVVLRVSHQDNRSSDGTSNGISLAWMVCGSCPMGRGRF